MLCPCRRLPHYPGQKMTFRQWLAQFCLTAASEIEQELVDRGE